MGSFKSMLLWTVVVLGLFWGTGEGRGEEGPVLLQGISYEDHFTFGRVVLKLNRPLDFTVERVEEEVVVKLPFVRISASFLKPEDLIHPDGTRLVQEIAWEQIAGDTSLVRFKVIGSPRLQSSLLPAPVRILVDIYPEQGYLAERYYRRGLSHQRKGEYDQAISSYQRAISLRGDHSGAYLQAGIIRMEQKRFTMAINNFKKALEGSPERFEAHAYLSAVYQKLMEVSRQKSLSEWEDFVEKAKAQGDTTFLISLAEFAPKEKTQTGNNMKEKVITDPIPASLGPSGSEGDAPISKASPYPIVLALVLGGIGAWVGYRYVGTAGVRRFLFDLVKKEQSVAGPVVHPSLPEPEPVPQEEREEVPTDQYLFRSMPTELVSMGGELYPYVPEPDEREANGNAGKKGEQVYSLVDAQWEVRDIARELKWSQGEVLLAKNLRRVQN